MSEFKTTLFKLLCSEAIVVIDGYEVESVQDYGLEDGTPLMRCECDDYHDWLFADQEVVVSDGSCQAIVATGDWDDSDEQVVAVLSFYVNRTITEGDLQ